MKHLRFLALALSLLCLLCACGQKPQSGAPAETPTEAEVTEAESPETEAPAVEEPETEPEVTEAAEPETEAPAVEVTEAEAPETEAPAPNVERAEPEAEANEEVSAGEAAEDPLSYTVTRDAEGNFEYLFDVLYVKVPADWEGKYTVIENDYGVNFYHTASLEAWRQEGYEGGFLFGIIVVERGFDPDYPAEQYLGYARDNQDYYMVFPTDVQGYMDNGPIFEEWQALNAGVNAVAEESYSMLFH